MDEVTQAIIIRQEKRPRATSTSQVVCDANAFDKILLLDTQLIPLVHTARKNLIHSAEVWLNMQPKAQRSDQRGNSYTSDNVLFSSSTNVMILQQHLLRS